MSWSSLMVAGMSVVGVFGYGVVRMMMPQGGKPLVAATMQGNFSAQNPPSTLEMLQTVADLTRQASRQKPSPALYVWGESTAHDALHTPTTYLAFMNMVRAYHAAITVGTVIDDREQHVKTNSAVLFAPGEAPPQQYDKTQMVPFGEFIPLRSVLGAMVEKQFHFGADLVFGGHATTQVYTDPEEGKVSLGPFICYESMFPQMARSMTRQGANLLVTQSNDDWFQSDAAMEQHLSAVVLRAIENRRWVVRSTTTGVSCLLDSKGRVVQRAPTHTPAYVVGTVKLMEGQTLYVLCGDWFVLLCGVLILKVVWRKRRVAETV